MPISNIGPTSPDARDSLSLIQRPPPLPSSTFQDPSAQRVAIFEHTSRTSLLSTMIHFFRSLCCAEGATSLHAPSSPNFNAERALAAALIEASQSSIPVTPILTAAKPPQSPLSPKSSRHTVNLLDEFAQSYATPSAQSDSLAALSAPAAPTSRAPRSPYSDDESEAPSKAARL